MLGGPRPKYALTSAPHSAPTFPQLIRSTLFPLWLFLLIFIAGFPYALRDQLLSLSVSSWLSPITWRNLIFGYGGPYILQYSDEEASIARRSYLSSAYGRVLEVGAGSGELIKYYDSARIEHLYALEPFPPLVQKLRQKITARGKEFEQKTTVVQAGIEEKSVLEKKYGLSAGSVDTLVLVQCLCSIPEPKKHLREAVQLLKPGGKLIMIEHVASSHPTTRLLQDALTPIWSFVCRGCELNRDTIGNLQALQCWDDIRMERPDNQTTAALVPHVYLQATKKRVVNSR